MNYQLESTRQRDMQLSLWGELIAFLAGCEILEGGGKYIHI